MDVDPAQTETAEKPYSDVVKPLQTDALKPALQIGSVRNPKTEGVRLTHTEPVKQTQPNSANLRGSRIRSPKTGTFLQEADQAHEEHRDQRTAEHSQPVELEEQIHRGES